MVWAAKCRIDVDPVFRQQPADDVPVAGIADHQRAAGHRRAESRAEVVQNHDVFAGFAQLANDMAADVAGAAGDKDGRPCSVFPACHSMGTPRLLL